jgi:multidrug resistance efflux pump
MAAVPVIYETPSRRQYFRVSSPAEVSVGGKRYRTQDWSAGGFAIRFSGQGGDLPFGRPVQIGDPLPITFAVDFQGFAVSFCATASVVRLKDGALAARFLDLGERECNLLRHFSSSLLSGTMSSVEGVLKNLDRPVTKLSHEAAAPGAQPRRALRRVAIAALYLAAGLAIGGFALLAVLSRVTQVNVESAVTSTPLEQVVSADVGRIVEMNVKPGTQIRAGEPLFRVDNEIATHAVDTAREDLETAQIALRETTSRREQEENKRGVYQTISQSQLDVAAAKIKALTAQRDEARVEYERYKKLWEEGVVSRQLHDSKKATWDTREAELEQAIAEQKISATSAETTNSGMFFSGNFLVGDLAAARAAEVSARDQVKVAEEALQQASGQESKRLYRAPFRGVVLRVFKSAGMTVDRGEALIVLRQSGQEPYIDAYLTQDEAGDLAAGSRGTALIAATGKRYPVQVASVDRTAGFLKDIQTPKLQEPQFGARLNEERSAYAKIEFVGLSAEERDSIAPGLPVFVTVPKKSHFAFSLIRTVHAASADAPGAPRLWPADSPLIAGARISDSVFEPVRRRVLNAADAALGMSAAPVETLRSAGVTDQSLPEFQQSRRAFQDADNFGLLALTYRLTGKDQYAGAARRIVNAWARVNRPTGNPIDETRLDAFLWGLDLLGADARDASVTAWLERWWTANGSWKFGPITATNNHKTHHLKIRLMLDRLLGKEAEYRKDIGATTDQLTANLYSADGRSIDYDQRDAMHYHIFDLEAWLEIELVTGCCGDRVDSAFAFFVKTLNTDPNHLEFGNSTAPIDRKRAAGGFGYAKLQTFDPRKAARAIFSYATIPGRQIDPELWNSAVAGEQASNLLYEARSYLWKARP